MKSDRHSLFCGVITSPYKPEKFRGLSARDGSHGRHGQCVASAEHRSDSVVAHSPAPQGRAQLKKNISSHFFASAESGIKIHFNA
ncbi:MAG: hypothetical protein NZ529_05650 [Cytophagaceae bacterium]|nr:hypothetical protein [Cytophagaceae bacterium]MDW8456261.1 hypothetical protein [Cytophagaceae bacterium]